MKREPAETIQVTSRASKNFLNQRQVVTLSAWVMKHQAWLENDQPTIEAVMKRITEEIPFTVTIGNLRGLVLKALDINWPRRNAILTPNQKATEVLGMSLLNLYRELGQHPPSELLDLMESVHMTRRREADTSS